MRRLGLSQQQASFQDYYAGRRAELASAVTDEGHEWRSEHEDTLTIVLALADQGCQVGPEMAYAAWRLHSEASGEAWSVLPKDGEVIAACLWCFFGPY